MALSWYSAYGLAQNTETLVMPGTCRPNKLTTKLGRLAEHAWNVKR